MLSPEAMIGPYRIIRQLGRGGMGTVYEAEDTILGRPVALKLIQFAPGLSEEGERMLRARFKREARAAGMLNHPNIVTIYQAGEFEGQEYLAMELVDGSAWSEFLRVKDQQRTLGLQPEEIWAGYRQVASALDYAHERGVIHRDVKPANILVSRKGVFKVADFGIAKLQDTTKLTLTDAVVGTPHYTPPEVLKGNPATARSDQYALGVMAYELLTGELPFDAPTTEALYFKILLSAPPSPTKLNPALAPGVDAVLARVLDKDPLLRFRSCTEFVEQLIAACGQQSEKDQTKKRVKGVAPTAPSKPLFVPILAGVTIAAILTIGIYYWMQNDTGSASGYRIPNSVPVVLLSNELLPAPSIDRLPPGTKDAGFQYPEFPHRVVGPRRPKAGLQILRTQPGANDIKLLLEGADGTLYVATERERLWAIRDRKVIWGFEVNTYQFSASSLGLMKPYDAVFNAAGQGGHLRNTPWYEALPSPLPHGLESRLIGRQEYCKSAYPLDHDCENGTGDGAGNVYLLTATKNLYAFDQNRKQLWVTPVPCRAPELMEFAGDTLVLGCRAARDGLAESLVGVREGKVAWTFKADTDISFSNSPASGSFLVDGTGAMYFVDTADPIHLYGLNRDGREMWRYNLGRTRVEGMWLDSRGRLFLSHDFWRNGASGAALTCLADKGC